MRASRCGGTGIGLLAGRGAVMRLERTSSPLRGRDDHLATIAQELDTVRTGVGRVVIVEGAAGLGKTSVLAAATALEALVNWIGYERARPWCVRETPILRASRAGYKPCLERAMVLSSRPENHPFGGRKSGSAGTHARRSARSRPSW